MNILHIVSRGVDKRKIYLDDSDFFRFIHCLYEFNDEETTIKNVLHHFKNHDIDLRGQYHSKREKERKPIIDIYAFCLMSNHYHLLVGFEKMEDVSKFMMKLNVGYAKYFNIKYERVGALFEGRYKRIPITTDAHLIHLPYYIHLNPLDYFAPQWREREINNFSQVKKYLENYRWSSHLDYLGVKNFPSVINKEFLLEIFGGEKEYRKSVYDWLKNIEIGNELKQYSLEN